jgi:hypothetical protein
MVETQATPSNAQSNGVIRVGRKGKKKFAFGDGPDDVFEVDVVEKFQEWISIDESFRPEVPTTHDRGEKVRPVPNERMAEFHAALFDFAKRCAGDKAPADLTLAEAIEFKTKLMEVYDELSDFFVPKSREKSSSPLSAEARLSFSPDPTT